MPDFEFRGASPGMYPMLRDSSGLPVGTVDPGDVAAFDAAPDADWVPAGDAPPQPATAAEAALELIGAEPAAPEPAEPAEPQASSEQGNDDTAATGQEEADQ